MPTLTETKTKTTPISEERRVLNSAVAYQARLELARRTLIDFTCHTFPNYQAGWHHELLAEYLDQYISGNIKRLIVTMPPRHGKSELVSRRLPAFILGKNPDATIIATSYTADLATRMNRDVQRIMDDPSYKQLFPETRLSGANVRSIAQGTYLRNSDIFEVVGRRGYYKSAGVGGAITGMGCNYGIIDDPIKNRAEAESLTFRKMVYDWYISTFYTRLESNASILITMTRWHEDDLVGRLLDASKNDPGADQWVVLNLPATTEKPGTRDPRSPGEALWPEKYSDSELRSIKITLGTYDWESLYQQNPSSPEGMILERAWWQYYRQAPNHFDEIIQSWDCTFKDTDGTDYVVGQVWGKLGSNKYLLDQVRDRMDLPTTIRAIKNLSNKWPLAEAKYIEDKANGPAVIQMLKGQISGLIAVEPEGGKVVRARAVSPTIEAGDVYLPDRQSWVNDFVEECAAFPNGKFDDQVDAMTQALNRLSYGIKGARGLGNKPVGW